VALLESADVTVKREMEAARDEVRVMTVHGAKGLEAPVVILPDTTSRAKPQGPSLTPVDLPDGTEGWLMCPGRSGDDCPASRGAREARVARTDAESLRLLYVALTRARDRLILMGRALRRPEAGFEPKSWWDVLGETFDRLDEEPDQVRDLGDGVRRIGADPEALGEDAARIRSAAIVPPAWTRAPPTPDAAARYASPSKMEAAARLPAPSPLSTGGVGGSLGRFRRGDLIHRLLERLPELPPADRPDAANRMMSRERDLNDDQRHEMVAAAFAVLDDPVFAPVFGPGSRAEAALTGGAPELPAGVRISGRIDRLVVTPDRVLVVDYKTNRPPPTRIEDADPAYVLQLAVYAAVLSQLYPNRRVEAALVWTDGPRLMEVPEAMMRAALAAAR
jgi:ATP-dependent helicase/nuclease subunit A